MQRGNGAVIGKLNTPTASVATGVWALNEVQRAVLNGTWPAGAAPDPYFENVTMLLHGDGTNGAQNNTFLDSSTNNFTITRNGNTTQGTFAPYGSNWSNYCTSSSGFLSVAASANLASNTGSFTLEFWYNSTATGNGRPLGNNTGNSFGTNNWVFAANDPSLGVGKLGFYVFNYGAYIASSTSSTVASDGQWHHIVLVRSGNTWAMFIDGVRQGSAVTSSVSFNGTSSAFNIGWSNVSGDATGFSGYLSNVRFVNGTAVYDPTQTTLTVPTGPLTAITNTALLTAQSNRFIDNSTNAFVITVNGSPSVQRFSPFNPTAPYAAGTDGGSGYFDGTGDWLSLSSATALGLSTGDFTVEAYVYVFAFSAIQAIFDGRSSFSASPWALSISSTGLARSYDGTVRTGGQLIANAWNHVAWVRSGGTNTVYVNGAVGHSWTNGGDFGSSSPLLVGRTFPTDTDFLNGYIASGRIVKGTAVYTTTFTPPTSPLTAITNTSLLLNFTNAGILDNAEMNNLETVGNAQISTAQSKFGGASMLFDGSGDRLYGPSNQNFNFGTGDFTIEFWVNPISQGGHGSSNNDCLIDFRPGSNGVYGTLYIFSNGTGVYWYVNSANRITGGAISNSVWTHIALCRASGSTRLFLNGTQSGSTYTDSNNYLVSPIMIGEFNDGTGGGNFNGYIDDLRITKGYARYTANFTPPTAPFPDF